MLNDNETETDLLSYEPIAATIAALLTEQPTAGTEYAPVTIGVHGDWGAGKSSVLEMVARAMDAQKDFLTLKFNGWRYQGFEDAKISLLETIVEELIERRPILKDYGAKLASLWKRINWLKVAKKVAGTAATVLTAGAYLPVQLGNELAEQLKPGEGEKWLKDPENAPGEIRAFRKEFDELLKLANVQRLIILIDDLDRCLPATTIETLEAMRLFLFTSRTAFVIAADEAMVEYCVRNHFPALTDSTSGQHFARHYLEKLIQVPFRIPALGINETRLYTSLLLIEDTLSADHDLFKAAAEKAREQLKQPWRARALQSDDFKDVSLPDEVRAALSLADQIGSVLAEGTQGNPRQVKRFIMSLRLRYRTADARGFAGALQLNMLAKLMLAERFQPRLFEQIERSVASSGGGLCHELGKLEEMVSSETDEDDDDDGEVKKTPGEDLVSQWYATDEVLAWARLEPKLGATDLRPYFFITRDRKRSIANITSLGELDGLVQKLLGSATAVTALTTEVRKLSPTEHDRVFEALKQRVQSADNFVKAPPGLFGLRLLAQINTALSPRLLDILEALPEANLGVWAPAGWGTTFAGNDGRFAKLIERWSKCESNVALATAATAAAKILKSKVKK